MKPDAVEVADATIAVADHLADELEEALDDHHLSRPSFLILDALDRAEGGRSGSGRSSTACAERPDLCRYGSGAWSARVW